MSYVTTFAVDAFSISLLSIIRSVNLRLLAKELYHHPHHQVFPKSDNNMFKASLPQGKGCLK
eukprot:3553624-Amphidinium_carterae.1